MLINVLLCHSVSSLCQKLVLLYYRAEYFEVANVSILISSPF